MTRPLILVTGAAGQTGAATVHALAEYDVDVRALVRVDDARAARLRATSAEVQVGNLDDYRDLRRAMRGVQRAYFVAAPGMRSLDHGLNFAAAAVDERVEHVVALGQWLAHPAHPAMATRRVWATDKLMSWLPGVSHTIVNVGWFADNFMPTLGMAAQLGVFGWPLGDGRATPVSAKDIGAVVAGILADPRDWVGAYLRPTGPASLSPEDLASAFGVALRRRVTYRPLPTFVFRQALRGLNLLTPLYANQLPIYLEEYRRGAFDGVTDVVPRLTGRAAEDFASVARRHAATDPNSRRSFGGFMRVLGQLFRTAVTKPYDLETWRDAVDAPRLCDPILSTESPEWRRSHPHDLKPVRPLT